MSAPDALEAGRVLATPLGPVRVLDRAGEGGRSTAYRVEWNGRRVALKVYKPRAIARHARKHPVPLHAFEHERNAAFFGAPGLAEYVAEPFGAFEAEGVTATLQELLEGELYYFWYRRRGGGEPSMSAHLARMIELAHAARLHDLDFHSMNVMVVKGPDGEERPKLFDFNLIPFHVRPPNPLVGLALRLGLLDPRARDLRKLRDFHDFRRVERKLLRFYEP